MNKEQKYIDWLISNQKEINNQIEMLQEKSMKNHISLIENQICPYCFNGLKEELFFNEFNHVLSYCNHCGYSHFWETIIDQR